MDSGAQKGKNGDTKEAETEGNRDKVIKFRVNAREDYLLKKIDSQLGYNNVSTTLRYLIENFSTIEEGKQRLDKLREIRRLEAELLK